MSWLDFLKRSPEKQLARLRKKVKEPHGDPAIRQGAAEKLFAMGTPEAWRALLDRFTISVSPSVQDEAEKQQLFQWFVEAGEKALPPLVDYIKSERSVYWPVKIVQAILGPEEQARVFAEILRYLWANPPASAISKVQLLQALSEVYSPELEAEVRRYLEDQDDDVRLAAVRWLLNRPEDEAREPILECYLSSEDRPRVRNHILQFLMEKNWSVRGYRPAVEESLPDGFHLTREGRIRRVGD